MKPFLFAANWKMFFSLRAEEQFFKQYQAELVSLARTSNTTVALFPSFVSLPSLCTASKDSPLKIGAQDCSAHELGAYTGQVAAQSLAELGCSYTIIGHSERKVFQEGATAIADKAKQLFAHNICPIICVGETQEEYRQRKTKAVLEEQLRPFLPIAQAARKPFFVAYEPQWAIGSGVTPTPEEIATMFDHLAHLLGSLPKEQWSLLYGGSISAVLAPQLYTIAGLGGLLIGKASTDFQEFKKIVLSRHSTKN